ncbi:CLUMA_CG010434, isoform A [Clunio marinus]|uniref:CLUMA_CG010434, isoform A n=1 Tax=Clunio marinus TaxID=568069 RepID=A0A1J1I9R2_9DIPT|nr:CLUMA_CG010434, isoform A [Clunio marinus]
MCKDGKLRTMGSGVNACNKTKQAYDKTSSKAIYIYNASKGEERQSNFRDIVLWERHFYAAGRSNVQYAGEKEFNQLLTHSSIITSVTSPTISVPK